MKNEKTYKTGDMAYIDSFQGGIVPCKVIAIHQNDPYHFQKITVLVTADRPGYMRGETVTYGPHTIVPRDMVRVRNGQYRIMGGYHWQND